MKDAVAIDVGGTNTRIMVGGKIVSFSTKQSFGEAMADIATAIQLLNVTPTAIGICTPGRFDSEQRQITKAFHLPDWECKPLVEHLEQMFSCSVGLLSDGGAAALGEAYTAPDREDLINIVWGTGLGIGVARQVNGVMVGTPPKNVPAQEQLHGLIGGENLRQKFGCNPEDLSDDVWESALNTLLTYLPQLREEEGIYRCVLGGGVTTKQSSRFARFLEVNPVSWLTLSTLKGNAGLYGAMFVARQKLLT
jgi:hypothetical protein